MACSLRKGTRVNKKAEELLDNISKYTQVQSDIQLMELYLAQATDLNPAPPNVTPQRLEDYKNLQENLKQEITKTFAELGVR